MQFGRQQETRRILEWRLELQAQNLISLFQPNHPNLEWFAFPPARENEIDLFLARDRCPMGIQTQCDTHPPSTQVDRVGLDLDGAKGIAIQERSSGEHQSGF